MDFNIKAIEWDNEKRIKRAKIIADEIIKSIDIREEYCALEFGCGTGLVSFNLIDKFKHITLIDTSEGMIETVNSKIQDLKVKNMKAIQVDINDNVEIQGEKFNVIYTSMALHHIIDIRTTLKNLYGMLMETGYLCIVELVEDDGSFHKSEKDFNGHNGFNQERLKRLLEELEFKSVVTNIFYNDVKIIESSEINYSLFLMIGKK
ncbi:class I SAM-dependent methyltransferase [Clostridium sp.]|uniref:class I SAM-dependent DNA methyltransferase n=1 Tax=Clostridium sp. TaxID=1506 RepID=UPI0035A15332